MTVKSIDHANIRTSDVPGTIAFFKDVLGMEASVPPGGTSLERAGWLLDAEGRAVIHVAGTDIDYPTDEWRPAVTEMRADTGRLHHVALSCSGFDAVRDRVYRTGLEVAENAIETIGLRQIFVTEPNGVLLELNFWND